MTDREEFGKWWELFEDVPTSTWDNEHLHNLAILAWQARGELDAVKIKELEAKLNDTKNYHIEWCSANVKIAELTAKLDKAREAIKNLINENVSNREYNSSKSIYNITAENKAINLLEELDK